MEVRLKEATEEIFIILYGLDNIPKETHFDFWKVSEVLKKYKDG